MKPASSPNEQTIADLLISLEKAALDRWGRGDPQGFLDLSAEDVVYFDPYTELRLDGKAALTKRYKEIWGMVKVDRFELLNPKVQLGGDLAVLTFNYVSWAGAAESRWNCTEVYRRENSRWLIIQTHWSYTRHPGVLAE
jgi:ketosteroid isomerase-like protein